eukprot:scaffold13626_cov56-Phaeocystis_antarctica.AAC.2
MAVLTMVGLGMAVLPEHSAPCYLVITPAAGGARRALLPAVAVAAALDTKPYLTSCAIEAAARRSFYSGEAAVLPQGQRSSLRIPSLAVPGLGLSACFGAGLAAVGVPLSLSPGGPGCSWSTYYGTTYYASPRCCRS